MTAEASIFISDESGSEAPISQLREALVQAAELHHVQSREISVLLCDDDMIRELNRNWRGLDEATDVLSFPSGFDQRDVAAGGHPLSASIRPQEGDEPVLPLGDVAISVPYAARQATARGVSLDLELTYLAVHGFLHLLGYDDESDDQRSGMIAEMNRVMAAAGLPEDRDWSSLHPGEDEQP